MHLQVAKKTRILPQQPIQPTKFWQTLVLIAIPTYADLNTKAFILKYNVTALKNSPTQGNLEAAQDQWFEVRTAWEQSEGMLFGPVADQGLDPAIDTWPVSQVEVDSLLNTAEPFTESFIEGLGEGLKGFHPMEYLLFGQARTRKIADLDTRDLDYLVALAINLEKQTEAMLTGWAPSGGNYSSELSTAGKGSATYAKRQDGILEVANAVIGIVDEVGNGKIEEPFVAKDSLLEESPFAISSWTDFTNNILGAKNIYMGTVQERTAGSLHSLVAKYNSTLDAQIQRKFNQAIASLSAHTTPFGRAIYSQPSQVQSTQAILKSLQTQMEDELIPLIQLQVKD